MCVNECVCRCVCTIQWRSLCFYFIRLIKGIAAFAAPRSIATHKWQAHTHVQSHFTYIQLYSYMRCYVGKYPLSLPSLANPLYKSLCTYVYFIISSKPTKHTSLPPTAGKPSSAQVCTLRRVFVPLVICSGACHTGEV